MHKALALPLAALTLALMACDNTAVNKDRNTTFLNSNDMETMTNQMAKSIIADSRIQAATAAGPLKIVIRPVDNLTDEIIPGNEAELFVARLQGLLASRPELANRFVWCVNRSDYAKLRAEEIPESKIGISEDRLLPEYQLYAVFRSATNVTRKGRSDTYLCDYKLTKISNGNEGLILWAGSFETSKAIKKGFLD